MNKKRKNGWNTSDLEEIVLRRERAAIEEMSVKALAGKKAGPFQDFEVSHAEGKYNVSYLVEIRSLEETINTCSCPDFRKNGLGTCKHIEKVLASFPRKWFKTRGDGAPLPSISTGELYLRRSPRGVVFLPRESMKASSVETVKRYFDAAGNLLDGSADGLTSLLATCERLNARTPGAVRVSAELKTLADKLRRDELLRKSVADFAAANSRTDGAWPFLKQALYPYQVEGALHLAAKGRAILADEMGLGKTVQAIAAALLLKETVGINRVLVAVPTSLKGEWEDQINQFCDIGSETLMGDRHVRLERYAKTRKFFFIANYEQVLRDWREINSRLKPDLIILDEAQRIKNWNTKTARNFKRLESPYAFVLTGTPLENRIDEFYSLAEFVDPNLFGSLFRFNREYYKFDDDGKQSGLQNLEDLHAKAQTIMLRRRKDLVEDELPERTDKTYFVPMTNDQLSWHEEYKCKVARLCTLAQKRPLTVDEMKLMQQYLACMRMLCDSCYILDSKTRESPKVDEAVAILRDLFASDPNRKVVIFSEWVKMLELMEEALEESNIGFAVHTGAVLQKRRREEIRRFKTDPGCRVLLSSESGGVGLNLQAASVIMNLDLPWNPAKLEQRIARAWRKHQVRDVLVLNLVSELTIEHAMIATLKYKQGLADAVLDGRGDFAVFGKPDARKAFVKRVSELLETALPAVTRANGTASTVERDDSTVPLAEDGVNAASESVADLAAKPETLELLQRLAAAGLITLGDQLKAQLESSATAASAPPPSPDELLRAAREKRRRVARETMERCRRDLRMAEVLSAGGFADEAEVPCRRAIVLAAAVPLFVNVGEESASPDEVPDAIAPVDVSDLIDVRNQLALAPEMSLTLQFAAQSLPLADCLIRTRAFLEECEWLPTEDSGWSSTRSAGF